MDEKYEPPKRVLLYLNAGGHDDPDDLYQAVASPEWRQAVASGQTEFEAALKVHGLEKVRQFAERAEDWVIKTVWALPPMTVAVAYGRRLLIELAAWRICRYEECGAGARYRYLAEGEGIAFYAGQDMIRVLAYPGERIIRLPNR